MLHGTIMNEVSARNSQLKVAIFEAF